MLALHPQPSYPPSWLRETAYGWGARRLILWVTLASPPRPRPCLYKEGGEGCMRSCSADSWVSWPGLAWPAPQVCVRTDPGAGEGG